MTPGSEDVETAMVRRNEEDTLEPIGVDEETLESCLIDFPTWTVSFKRKRSNRGKKIVREESSADSFGMKAALDMTPEEMVEEFLMNSV